MVLPRALTDPAVLATLAVPAALLVATVLCAISYAIYSDARDRRVSPAEIWGVLVPSRLVAGVLPGVVAAIGYGLVRRL